MKRVSLFILMMATLALSFAAEYVFYPEDSPFQNAYGSNTYDENGWTDIEVTHTDVITGIRVEYTWTTDEYAYEGALVLEAPDGSCVDIARGQESGVYSIINYEFVGIAMNGDWKLYITDVFGDGGHEATDV